MKIRQPIITVAGHVDHGKTSILDSLRGTKIQEGEAGGITQKISFTTVPKDTIKERAGKVIEQFKIPLEIPAFLFIDTPGHAAFTNLRKRGGSLADLAILVIDINDGIKPQTAEVLKILKENKTPFIIALNKIDNISGWKASESKLFFESQNKQAINVKQNFDEKFYTIIGALNSHGIESDIYTEIKDFTTKVAIVPCSAKTGEGITEILAMLSALSQRYLMESISIQNETKGVILEVKKDRAINYAEAILYDGELNINDEIAIASLEDGLIKTKIRNMQEALPLNKGFKNTDNAIAAAGLKLQLTTKDSILPGMPFRVLNDNFEKIKEEFSKEIEEEIQTDGEGIYVKADSLGSLEAILVLLREKNISVGKASIGDITKKDIYTANSLPEEDRVLLGFNVSISDDVGDLKELDNVRIISDEVVYKIIEDYEEWRKQKQLAIERKKLEELPTICKLEILDFVFRNTSPAIFGVKIAAGKLKKELKLINKEDKEIGRVKTIQENKDTLPEAEKGKEVAISLPGVNFERQLAVGETLYTELSEFQFRKFKEYKNLLTPDEKSILKEIAGLKRRFKANWGV